jgi:hypothetical protein
MNWLKRKIGWLLCLAGGLALAYAGGTAFLLCAVILSGGFHPLWFLIVVITVPLGLCLAKLGTVMCRD